jgi:ribosome maturation factor RimP
MADAHARESQRAARTLLTKHGLDLSRAQVSVAHGVCYVRGIVTPAAGHKIDDVEAECQRVAQFIRQKPGIRQVVLEISVR